MGLTEFDHSPKKGLAKKLSNSIHLQSVQFTVVLNQHLRRSYQTKSAFSERGGKYLRSYSLIGDITLDAIVRVLPRRLLIVRSADGVEVGTSNLMLIGNALFLERI